MTRQEFIRRKRRYLRRFPLPPLDLDPRLDEKPNENAKLCMDHYDSEPKIIRDLLKGD